MVLTFSSIDAKKVVTQEQKGYRCPRSVLGSVPAERVKTEQVLRSVSVIIDGQWTRDAREWIQDLLTRIVILWPGVMLQLDLITLTIPTYQLVAILNLYNKYHIEKIN